MRTSPWRAATVAAVALTTLLATVPAALAAADDVASVTATQPVAAAQVGYAQRIDVVLRDTGGVAQSDVTPVAVVLTGPHAGTTVTCTASDATGTAVCSYPVSTIGMDDVRVWVDRSGGTDGAIDPGEVGATVVRYTQATLGPRITAGCDQWLAGRDQWRVVPECTQPLGVQEVTFTFTIGNAGFPFPDFPLPLEFADSGTVGAVTWSADVCVTDAEGRCTVTAVVPSPSHGGWVTAEVPMGAGMPVRARVRFEASRPASLRLEQALAGALGGEYSSLARLYDQFGMELAGVPMAFTVTGRNVAAGTVETYEDGSATFTYVDDADGDAELIRDVVTARADHPYCAVDPDRIGCTATGAHYWYPTPTLTGPKARSGPGTVVLRGTARPGALVELWHGDTIVAATVSDEDGRYVIGRPLTNTARLWVVADGLQSAEHTVLVRVAPRMTVTSPSRGRVTVTVDIAPRRSAVEVRVWQLLPDGTRRRLGTNFTNPSGRVTRTFALTPGSTTRLQAVVIGTGGLGNGATAVRRITVAR